MPFQRYAVPFIMRDIGPLRVKQKLMEMDLSTADGVINQLGDSDVRMMSILHNRAIRGPCRASADSE